MSEWRWDRALLAGGILAGAVILISRAEASPLPQPPPPDPPDPPPTEPEPSLEAAGLGIGLTHAVANLGDRVSVFCDFLNSGDDPGMFDVKLTVVGAINHTREWKVHVEPGTLSEELEFTYIADQLGFVTYRLEVEWGGRRPGYDELNLLDATEIVP